MVQNYFQKFMLFAWLCTCSCNHSHYEEFLQEGDLLFQDLDCGELCDAIEAVTQGVDGRDFSHCAMVVQVNDTLKVIEAIGDQVQLNSLHHFFARSGDTLKVEKISIARLKNPYSHIAAKAASEILGFMGMPYDDDFSMSNEKYYCSEIIHEAFKSANNGKVFFEPAPMTFKQPEKDEYFPVWLTYFKDLGIPIPEGEPGINPGLISRSDKLEIVKIEKMNWN
jgi:hypothetical protein